jgi:hypothetical protein
MNPWCLVLGREVDVDAFKQVIEHALIDAKCLRIIERLRQSEGAFVEPLVEDAEPVAVREEHFHRSATATKKNIESTAARATRHALVHNANQAIKAPPQVDC